MNYASNPVQQLIGWQRELLERLDEFFCRATGKSAWEFATRSTFGDEIRRNANELAPRAAEAYPLAYKSLREFYEKQKSFDVNSLGASIGGHKLVLGGSNRFLESQANAIHGAMFWADTVLLRDPILPWIEDERAEERFRNVLLLQAAHSVLLLRDFIGADLSNPPIIIYPTWERSRANKEHAFQEVIGSYMSGIIGKHMEAPLCDLDQVFKFVRDNPANFLSTVEANRLFVPPGGNIGMSVDEALAAWHENNKTWRTPDHLTQIEQMPKEAQVLTGLLERLEPQFHTATNALALGAHPLFAVEQQAYYFKLTAQYDHSRLTAAGLLEERTVALIEGLSTNRLAWLSDAPVEALLESRRDGDHVAFRKRLQLLVGGLHESKLRDANKVAAELVVELDNAISQHNRQLRDIDEKYSNKNFVNAIAAVGAISVNIWPELIGVLGRGAAPFAAGVAGLKVAHDISDRDGEKERLSRSMIGVLANIKSENDDR